MMQAYLWLAFLLGATGSAFAADAPGAGAKVAVTLAVKPECAPPAGKFDLRLTAVNNSDQTVTLFFRSGQQYDFAVSREGRPVWRWSHGKFFTMATTQVILGPGERRTFATTWNQVGNDGKPVPEGEYAVTGTLTTMPPLTSTPVTVRVAK